jgi:hypothetical protein
MFRPLERNAESANASDKRYRRCAKATNFTHYKRAPLATFLSQLKIRETHEVDCCMLPMNSQYQIRRPWASGIPLKTYRSHTGDSLDIQIWKVDDATVGVLLYTDWN